MPVQVALVDDERVARDYIGGMRLWREGRFALAINAASAQELLAALDKVAVDILLMDVSMPDMDGIALSSLVAKRYPQIAIVAVSNFDGYDFVRQIMKNGAKDYLLKHRLDEPALLGTLSRLTEEGVGEPEALRAQLARYLSGQAPCPLPADGAQTVACFGQMAALGEMPEEQREMVRRGVEQILEQGSQTALRKAAVAYGGTQFLLFLRFYEGISAAAIQQQAHFICAAAMNETEQIYHARLTLEAGPVMRERKALLKYVEHRAAAGACKAEAEQPRDTLSVDEQKDLLFLLSQGDFESLGKTIRAIFANLKEGGLRQQLFIAKAMIDMARAAAEDWGCAVALPPAGNELFTWMRRQSREELTQSVLSLYQTLIAARREQPFAQCSAPVRGAAAFIQEHYDQPVSLGAIARILGVNESYLSRLFKKETGMTVGEFLLRTRMEKAGGMLARDMPIKKVAFSVGFVQYTHFLRVFKQVMGVTPKQYAQKVKNG